MSTLKTIGPHSDVILHFVIKLKDGSIAEDTRQHSQPARLKMGTELLTPGFEAVLIGLKAGDKKKFVIHPEDGFGLPDPMQVRRLLPSQFPADIELEEGLIVSFTQPNGVELPGIIRHFSESAVEVDFNHPLSGQKLLFDVEILSVDEPHESS
jgi:FKBP-type peptidyl-prolyl cis-trans isomerase SlpA